MLWHCDPYDLPFKACRICVVTYALSMLNNEYDKFYITARYLLELANRAYELFKSSEVEERRQLIKLVLSNLRVEDKIVRYDAIKPFDTILNDADGQLWLPAIEEIRNNILYYRSNIDKVALTDEFAIVCNSTLEPKRVLSGVKNSSAHDGVNTTTPSKSNIICSFELISLSTG